MNRPATQETIGVDHVALVDAEGSDLGSASITDRQKLAVLLQASGLLSHLSHAGWRLERGWCGARVTPAGALCGVRVAAGSHRALPQDHLLGLLELLFEARGGIPGRGEARRAARTLHAAWRQGLVGQSPDVAVAQILRAAPFLWEATFSEARKSLVAEHARGGRRSLWIAGPGQWRRRLRLRFANRETLESTVASPQAQELLETGEERLHDAAGLLAAHRFKAAADAFARRPPKDPRDQLLFAQALFGCGRFEAALRALRGNSGIDARILKVHCEVQLGKLRPARATLRHLEGAKLAAPQLLTLADVAIRIHANIGDRHVVRAWAARALRAAPSGAHAGWARLLAAAAAWDLGEAGAMADCLDQTPDCLARPELAWRYCQLRGLEENSRGNGERAVDWMSRGLRESRRSLRRFEAGRLWNELAVARVTAGDLGGAERACRHAVSLLGSCDGPTRETLALYNLAEVRIRRGRLMGVETILEAVAQANRLEGNLRGGAQDAELYARFELARGNAQEALDHCERALDRLAAANLEWHAAELHVFAARALGWLGRRDEARSHLARSTLEARRQVEAEEGWALWAHAGLADEAYREGVGTPFDGLWSAALAGQPVPSSLWQCLESLEPFRAARFVLDCALLSPQVIPEAWIDRAEKILRRVGAVPSAERLRNATGGAWHALAAYLEAPEKDPGAFARLFAASGHSDVSLCLEPPHGDAALAIVDGAGGPHELSAIHSVGRLRLAAPRIDERLRALFLLALRDLDSGLERQRQSRPEPAVSAAFLGRSAAVRAALERLARLATGSLPLLVLGETGTGKELAAHEAHRISRRRGAFAPINCAALSSTELLLSELFGHVRGAFTGADRDHQGVFETARGGTVFLDEIGDLPPVAQGMLLRVLQESEVRRLGESLPRRVDVRVVAATHRDLEAMTRSGAFRQDLLFRLKVATIRLPPLRERLGDVRLLAEAFLAPPPAARLTPEARNKLQGYSWPGNVRELKNVLEVAKVLALAEGATAIDPQHLDIPAEVKVGVASYQDRVERYRRDLIREALDQNEGNQAQAARQLGLSRQALSYLVRKLKIG
jgi:DNA-binding NtrC family response regulator